MQVKSDDSMSRRTVLKLGVGALGLLIAMVEAVNESGAWL
jgi:hypothetical protein